MYVRIMPIRAALVVSTLACASALACVDSPGPPNKATTAQIDQMNEEVGGASSGFGIAPPDWPAMSKAIRGARDSVDRMHWISEFAHHAAALPESLRIVRLAELRQLIREVP
jgi:hypothetical protein